MNGSSSSVMSRPEAILQAQQFSKRLWQDAGKLVTDVEALKQQRVPAPRIAMYLATEHPSIKLIGVLLQLAPENRLPVLTGDGGLTLEQARAALQPVERLQHDPELRQALAQAMPSWFSSMPTGAGKQSGIDVLLLAPILRDPALIDVLQKLRRYCAWLMGMGLIGSWVESNPHTSPPGRELNDYQLVLLFSTPTLAHPDFLRHWLPRLSERVLTEGMRIVPLLAEPVDWEETLVASLAPLPADGTALSSRRDRDAAWQEVMAGLRRAIEHQLVEATKPPPPDVPEGKPQPAPVVVLYAEADRALFQPFANHLRPLERDGQIEVWHPGLLVPGEQIDKELRRHVRQAKVVVLLLSADFLASDSLAQLVNLAIERERAGEVRLLPVRLRPVDDGMQLLFGRRRLPDAQPVVHFPDADYAWIEVMKVLEAHLYQQPNAERQP